MRIDEHKKACRPKKARTRTSSFEFWELDFTQGSGFTRDPDFTGILTSQGSRRLPVADHPVGFRTGFELDAHISGKHHEVIPTRLQHTPGDLSTAAAAPAAAVDAVATGARIPG